MVSEQDLIDMTSDLIKAVTRPGTVAWLRAVPTTTVVAHAVRDGEAACAADHGPQWYPPLEHTRRCRMCERKLKGEARDA